MNIPNTTDVVVVGCGIFGLSTAAFAALSGKQVVALERTHIGGGSSGRSGAIIRAFYYQKKMAQNVARCRENVWNAFDDVFKIKGEGEPVFRKTGMITISSPEIDGNVDFREWGIDIGTLTHEAVRDEFKYLRALMDHETVWWDGEAGYVHTALALNRLRECIENHGGVVAEHSPVTSITKQSGGAWLIETPNGNVSSGAVVIAPGPWANELGRMVDLELPVQPQRVQVALLNRQGTLPQQLPVISDRVNDFYARSLDGGISHVGFVSHFERTPLESMTDFDESIRPDLARILYRRFGQGLPVARNSLVLGHRAAVYSVTSDEYFILGKTPQPNLFVAAGGSGHGYKFGPVVGRDMASLIDGADAPFANDPMFAFEREFKEGRGVLGN